MFAGVAYVSPTGPGTCRQFHTFLQAPQPPTNHSSTASDSSGNHAANSSMSKADDKGQRFSRTTAPLSAWWAALRRLLTPTWRSHLASHVLLDADIVTQYGVDVNRCGKPTGHLALSNYLWPASSSAALIFYLTTLQHDHEVAGRVLVVGLA